MATERVLIIHEDEAGMLLHAVCEHVSSSQYDLRNDEDSCEIQWMLDLKKKLSLYLDGELIKDVITTPR